MSKPTIKPRGRALPDGKRKYGWVPDVPDRRDLYLATPRIKLPTKVDLRQLFPEPPYDQGELGSCTANAAAGVVQFDLNKQGLPVIMPSRLFVYFVERTLEGSVGEDAGATIRDSVKAINKGYPEESLWPYDIGRFADKPPKSVYAAAKSHRCVKYQRVQRTAFSMKACLARGFPFLLGFSVYESFESAAVARTGKVPMPKSSETMLGGHAVVCCGYDDKAGMWTCRNSWGGDWGDGGYFTLPYAYLLDENLADDFWAVSLVN